MSGPRDPRPPRPEETTAEEPWWKNANTRVPPQPPPPPPPPYRSAPPPPPPRSPMPAPPPPPMQTPGRSRHAKTAPTRRGRGQVALLGVVGVTAIAAAAVVIGFGLSRLDGFNGKALDVSKAEAGVQQILLDPTDGYSVTNVSDVTCNDGNNPEIKKGASFTCQVVVDGRKRQVLVLFTDDNGTYEVDRPR